MSWYPANRQEASRKRWRQERPAETGEERTLSLDFSGARGVAPSFLDESLLVAEEHIRDCGQPDATIIFVQPPTVLAAKHHAIARAHGRALVVTESGDWEFRKI